jgi:dihydrodipicolinate synthase/N-acetylneuraminate lyase
MNLVAADDMQSLYGLTRERKLGEAFAVQEKIRRGGCALFSGLDADPEIIKNGFMAIFNAPSASEIIHHTKPAHHLVKEALRLKGLPMTNQVRLPYARANAKQSSWLKKLLADFGWLGL